jgi:hypothetical protein
MALPSYTVWFRGHPACPCLATWLPVFETELIRRGVVKESIDIAQLIGGAAASGGTHASGGAFDIWQHDSTTVWVSRQMGADASWARGAPAFDPHMHGVLTGCPHNGPARYQIDEVRNGGDGLIGTAPDPGPRPLSGRTWREGIAWAKKLQQEDDMQLSDEYADGKRVGGLFRRLSAFLDNAGPRLRSIESDVEALREAVKDDATKGQAEKILEKVRGVRELVETGEDSV